MCTTNSFTKHTTYTGNIAVTCTTYIQKRNKLTQGGIYNFQYILFTLTKHVGARSCEHVGLADILFNVIHASDALKRFWLDGTHTHTAKASKRKYMPGGGLVEGGYAFY